MKKFKVIFMTDKIEEMIVEADKWSPASGESAIYLEIDNDPEAKAWFRNVVAVIEVMETGES